MIVFTIFRLNWIQMAYDFVDDFKIKKGKGGCGKFQDGERDEIEYDILTH